MAMVHGMDVYVAETASSMGSDGFRVLRMAFVGRRDPKKFAEAMRKNPELTLEEYAYVKGHATRVREIGIASGSPAKVTYRH